MAEAAKRELQEHFGVEPIDLEARVFVRLTDNWLELTVRFVVETHGIRSVKDKMSRNIIAGFDAADTAIASSTYDIGGFPTVNIERAPATRQP